MIQVEALLKAKYQAVAGRVRNPKGGIVENKLVRAKEVYVDLTAKPKRRGDCPAVDPLKLNLIRQAYEAGVPVERICEKFHVGSRTVRALRQRHGWPVRERVKPRAKV